jgi:N-acetylglucosaminyldiphosphoundecaprenol N-acetyl-beta-D-mannosaminyltransferase
MAMNVDTSKDAPVPPTDDPVPTETPGRNWSAIPRVDLITLVVVLVALAGAYAPNFAYFHTAWEQPDYTHGYLVLPIALGILWKRWPQAGTVPLTPWWPGWILVALTLVARLNFHESGQNWLEAATLLPVIVGLVLARLGWRFLGKTWPAFAFLVFLYPLPPQINSSLSQPLQSMATTSSCALLKFTGLWVMPEGNVILVGNEKLEVAAACNGLSMLMSLAATVAAAASLIPMSTFKRVSLLMSVIPIALGSNILRISATAWCYYRFGADVGKNYAHDWAGWLMMPTAMLLVWLELSIMSLDAAWVWGLPLSPMTRDQAALAVMDLIEAGRPSYFITANVHYAMLTAEHPELRPINDRAAFLLADGAPLVWASKRGPVPLPERVAGSDLVYDLCDQAARRGRSVFLLGGAEGVADEAARKLQTLYPALKIAGTACPKPEELAGDGCLALIDRVKATRPDLLLVALGQPKGEVWLAEHLDDLGVPAAAQVGATLDFVAGRVRRAPRIYQKIGLEWAYRISTDPARLGPRYAKNALFLFRRMARDLLGRRAELSPLMAENPPGSRAGESTP